MPAILLTGVLAVLSLVTNTPIRAASIGLDFGSTTGAGGATPAMGSSEVAGLIPQSHWNSLVSVNQATPFSLVDSTGAASGVTATWSGVTNNWSLPISGTGNSLMMKGYLENSAGGTITLSLTPSGASVAA